MIEVFNPLCVCLLTLRHEHYTSGHRRRRHSPQHTVAETLRVADTAHSVMMEEGTCYLQSQSVQCQLCNLQ